MKAEISSTVVTTISLLLLGSLGVSHGAYLRRREDIVVLGEVFPVLLLAAHGEDDDVVLLEVVAEHVLSRALSRDEAKLRPLPYRQQGVHPGSQ